jgi:hypothetical protein
MGFFMPPLFTGTSLKQYVDGEGIVDGVTLEQFPLKKIESEITRRIIKSLPSVIRSKGTQHSIKSFLRAVGINPDASLRIREYGGSKSKKLSQLREKRSDELTFFELGDEGLFQTSLKKIFNDEIDNPPEGFNSGALTLLTVRNWTIEANFQFNDFNNSQSVFRIFSLKDGKSGYLLNLLLNKEGNKFSLILKPGEDVLNSYVNPRSQVDLPIDGTVLNNEIWKISIGRKKTKNNLISEYFIRVSNLEGKSYLVTKTIVETVLTGNSTPSIRNFFQFLNNQKSDDLFF